MASDTGKQDTVTHDTVTQDTGSTTTEDARVTATCHCKAISITFPKPSEPANECLCSICRRYGALWLYYSADKVEFKGDVSQAYVWGDKTIGFHRCKQCGCVTHWAPLTEVKKHYAVNARMLEREPYNRLERRYSEGG